MKRFLLGSLIIAGVIFLIFWEGKKAGQSSAKVESQKEVIKQKEIEIEVKNEIIKENKKVAKRRVKARAVPISDDLIWLQQNICQDCNH